MVMDSALDVHRLHFAFTVTYHYLFFDHGPCPSHLHFEDHGPAHR